MARHFGGIVKGCLSLHVNIALEDVGMMSIEGLLSVEGPMMIKGLHSSGVMEQRFPEDPTVSEPCSVASREGTEGLAPRMIIFVWVFVALVRKVNMRIGLGVARGGEWVGGIRGLLARPLTRTTVIMLDAAMTPPYVAEWPAPDSPARLHERHARPVGRLAQMVILALALRPPGCGRLHGCTYLVRVYSVGPAMTFRRSISRPEWRQHRRPVHVLTKANTLAVRHDGERSTVAMRTSKLEGGMLRLGRATLSPRGQTRLGGYRPRQFEGSG